MIARSNTTAITPVQTPALKIPSIASQPVVTSASGTIGNTRRNATEVLVIVNLVIWNEVQCTRRAEESGINRLRADCCVWVRSEERRVGQEGRAGSRAD